MMRIYLASPYSHDDEAVREQRFDAVCEYAAKLMREGFHVYSPIAHGHAVARFGLPGDWEFWREHCEQELRRSDGMIVLQLDGWTESVGIAHELTMTDSLNIPVEIVAPWQMPLLFGAAEGSLR